MAFLQHSSGCRTCSVPHSRFSASPTIRKRSLSSSPRRAFMWWWTKHGTNGHASSLDDSFRCHILPNKKMLTYKYSKATRRRQSWDRDPSHNLLKPTWGWQVPGLSSTHDRQAWSSKSPPPASSLGQKPAGQEAFDDFAQLKACIDRDPFGAIFGRRLKRHHKPTDTSSSSSWKLDSALPKDGETVSHKPVVSNTPPTSMPTSIMSSNTACARQMSESSSDGTAGQEASTSRPSGTPMKSAVQDDEYEFDPISMRKVLKSGPKGNTSSAARRPLFDPLFAEKGVDIPVKPYQSRRVFGYSGKSNSTRPNPPGSPPKASRVAQSKAETSRLAELRSLKAATLGNSIDTTAQYHGKWVPEGQDANQKSKVESPRDSTAIDAPLFSGTTYEGKSKDIVKGFDQSKQDWLQREGFGTKQESSTRARRGDDPLNAENGRLQSPARLQPALDRFRSSEQASGKSEPSLNRLEASSRKATQPKPSQKPKVALCNTQDSTSEDLDLLRTSDVRASSRSSRQSTQGREKFKQEQHRKLNQDFESRREDDDGLSVVFPYDVSASSKRLSKSWSNFWHRIRARRMTWLDDKLQALSKTEDSVVHNPVESIDCKEQKAPRSRVDAIPNVCKAVASPVQTFTPSQEVLDAEKESKARMVALRNATLKKEELEAKARETEKALAQKLKAAYEDEYGLITINHRQAEDSVLPQELAKDMNEADVQPVPKKALVETKQEDSISPEAPPSTKPLLYKVLAYDPSTLSMTIAQTTSSLGDAEGGPLPKEVAECTLVKEDPTKVLSRLNNVAKFLPHFADLEKEGYEIVSGGGDVLVFGKIRSPTKPAYDAPKPSNAVTETSPKPSTPSFRPPSPADPVAESLAPTVGSSKVRRQEDVFSGSGQTWHQEEERSGSSSSGSTKNFEPRWFRKMVKRVFLTGAFTAAIAYTIGVVAEQAGARVQKSPLRRSGRLGIYSTEDSR